MSLEEIIEQIEGQFFGELEEDRDAVIPTLIDLHHQVISKGEESEKEFGNLISSRMGGIFIPYLFWRSLSRFLDNPEARDSMFNLASEFAHSSFDEVEQKKMKPLFITYFAVEKEFELDKIQNLVVEKAHPTVQEYFKKLFEFVKNNKNSVSMYEEKFNLLRNTQPDFELLRMPVSKLKEKLEIA